VLMSGHVMFVLQGLFSNLLQQRRRQRFSAFFLSLKLFSLAMHLTCLNPPLPLCHAVSATNQQRNTAIAISEVSDATTELVIIDEVI